MSSRPEPTPRSRRMSVGGKLSFRRRARAVDENDLPIVDGSDEPPALAELVPERFDAVEIEVGPGKGAFLCAAVEALPNVFLLGIEAAGSYARIAAAKLKATGRDNGLVLVDNAAEFLKDRVEAGALRRIHVYFPDPWPKRRHRGRRLLANATPAVMHRALEPGGWLLVATDNAALAGEVARVLGDSELFERSTDEEHRLAELPGHGFSPTNFERKYAKEGRRIRRYAFRRHN